MGSLGGFRPDWVVGWLLGAVTRYCTTPVPWAAACCPVQPAKAPTPDLPPIGATHGQWDPLISVNAAAALPRRVRCTVQASPLLCLT
ncbi:hypothetical protein BX600DRAFT_463121 [Xylariales sp. PMI_506]|nr:hypothetical protein BX600DRAFT_463121 [Xylariales sp. PMI_506]